MNAFRTRGAAVWLAVVLAVAGPTGCQPAPAPPAENTSSTPEVQVPPTVPTASADDAVNRVLAISIDGLNPRAITRLGPKKAPAFHRLMREGAYTLNARTEYELTKTLPNHTGMLTSRRVDRNKGGHGITINSDTGSTVHTEAGHYVASIFDVVHDRGGRTALFAAKTKFALFARTWNTHGRSDQVGKDHGRKKIDRVTLDTNNARLVAALNAELRSSPRTFTFLHVSLPDIAGHRYGFMSREYLAAVQQTDRLLGSVLTTIAGKPSLKAHTLVVLTADHGGNGANHSDPKKLQNYRIPFMTWGPGVARGRNLYAINPTLTDPKSSRPPYSGRQPIRNGDLANLVTDALDLPPIPGSGLNRPRTLELFAK